MAINDNAKPKRGRPITQTKVVDKSSQQGTKADETRATFIIKEDLLEKIKAIAYWDRLLFKDVIDAALVEHIDKSGVQPRPEAIRKKEQESNQKLIKNPDRKAKLPKF